MGLRAIFSRDITTADADASSPSGRGVPHKPSAPTLEMDHITVAYAAGGQDVTTRTGEGRSLALDDVSLRVRQGERLAVVGPNGAGKSTLLKLVAGSLKPTAGKVRVYGHQPAGHICIGYVPQRNKIDWSFPVTVADVVMMGRVSQIGLFRRAGDEDREIVQRSLEQVQAAHLADKQIGSLSGGQQQRVFLARALAQEAELLLMDEPLTGLDVPSQEQIFELLDDLRPLNVTIILATHDLQMAADRFDRVLLLNHRVVAVGPPNQVLTADNLVAAYGGAA